MSIYSSSASWTCPSANQSPINLSQSSAKPCDLLCELVMDDVMIPQANVIVSDEGLILQNTAGLGSCKFNGEGYTCTMVLVTHPSHHTIENIQADAEVIAVFTNPTGKYLYVSSLVRVNPAQSSATQFFNGFVGYANPTQQMTPVSLGENWGLFMMVPPAGSYFVYDGSMVVPPCQSGKWVVFKSMINIDPNDFALLVKNVSPGSRPIQPVGDREVFFNDTNQLPGGPMPQQDGKTYMRCKRVAGKGKDVKSVQKPDVKSVETKEKSKTVSGIQKFVGDQVQTNGILGIIDVTLMVIALLMGLYYGYQIESRSMGLVVAKKVEEVAGYIRNFFIRPTVLPITSGI